jgi:hypothetical protein
MRNRLPKGWLEMVKINAQATEKFWKKTLRPAAVEVQRRDAGNWDAHFKGMADDGGDIHVVMETEMMSGLIDNYLFNVYLIGNWRLYDG